MTFKFPGEVFLRLQPQSPVLNAALQRRHWPRWLRSAGPAHTAPPAVPFAIARAALPCRARSPERPRRSAGRLRSAARPSALPGSPAAPGPFCCISAGCSSLLFTVPRLRRPQRCPDPPFSPRDRAGSPPGQRHRASRPRPRSLSHL